MNKVYDKVFFYSKDGLRLVGIWNIPKSNTLKAIILVHGITVDKDEDGIFIELAELLKENGYAVFRFDFRGHGESEGRSVDMTIAGELLDLDAAVMEVKSKGYKKIGLLAASFGGSIAALYVAQNQEKIRCLCLWNPCLNYDHCFLNPFLPWLRNKIGSMRKDFKEKGWTTLGSRKFKIGKQLFDEMEQLFPYKVVSKINIPTIIIHGDQDTYVPYKDSKKYLKYLKEGELVTIKGGEHGFHDIKKHTETANQATLTFFKKFE